jgi:hypothetical protein
MKRDRRRPLLVNEGEFRTDAALQEAAADLGYRVFAKPRVADVLDIAGSGLSDELFGYGLRAHFDWVVADATTTQPEFAVEFDGPSHGTPLARRKDALKDKLCEHLELPLLRIDQAVLRPTIRRTVLYYLVESWRLMKAFDEAQARGDLPYDETFDAWAFVDGLDEHGVVFRDMGRGVRVQVGRLSRAGNVTTSGPSCAHRRDGDAIESMAWVETRAGEFIVGRARVRRYSFPAVLDFDLADDLALLDLGGRLARLTEGDETVLEAPEIVPRPGLDGGWSGSFWLAPRGGP